MSFTANGTNISTLFHARVNAKRADVGYQASGVDISNTYEAYHTGSTKAAATGFKQGANDLSDLFQKLNETGTVVWTTTAGSIQSEAGGNDPVACWFEVQTNGTVTDSGFGGIEDWGSNIIVPSDFQWMWNGFSGNAFDYTSGTSGTWYGANNIVRFGYGNNPTARSATFNLSFRKGTSGGGVLKACTISQIRGG